MTIAQSEESCVVSGMPRAAIMKGYANKIVALDGLAEHLMRQDGTERSNDDKKKKDKNEKAETIPVSSQRT